MKGITALRRPIKGHWLWNYWTVADHTKTGMYEVNARMFHIKCLRFYLVIGRSHFTPYETE